MTQFESVSDLGKIIFIPTQKSVPPLPEMSLLFFNEKERDIFPWRAACIDLEIDACGDSMTGAWESLRNSLSMYIEMEKTAAGTIVGAAKNITKVALADSKQKRDYFALYRQAKPELLIRNIDADQVPIPVTKRQNLMKLEME